MKKPIIAFVGLGAMGLHSARRLVQAGFEVRGCDLQSASLQALAQAGGVACTSAVEAVQGASHAVLFVVNGKQAEQVIFGPNGLAEGATLASSPLTIISCVTMSPTEAAVLGERCSARNWTFLDAPVSGGTVGAEQGTLTIMAAGEREAIESCRPLFAAISRRLMVVGERAGQGVMVKAINQLLCGVHLAAAGEAMAMAQRAGLDLQAVFDVVSQSAAGSWMLSDRGPRMVQGSFDAPTSAVDIFVKDLGIVQDIARELRFPAPLSASALQSFLGSSGAGNGKKDDAAVMQYYASFQP